MTDILNQQQRSACMASIRSIDTQPERVIRRMLHRLGYRYRLHDSRLPGKPDLVFSSRRKVVFIHGCFWHRHGCKKGRSMPATRIRFWEDKFCRNVERDRQVRRQLRRLGWRVLVIWECQIKRKPEATLQRTIAFIEG